MKAYIVFTVGVTLGAMFTACGTATSSRPASEESLSRWIVSASDPAMGEVTLEKGMSLAQVKALLGEPKSAEKEHLDPNVEVVTYVRWIAGPAEAVVLGSTPGNMSMLHSRAVLKETVSIRLVADRLESVSVSRRRADGKGVPPAWVR